jgi:hypothetical protein
MDLLAIAVAVLGFFAMLWLVSGVLLRSLATTQRSAPGRGVIRRVLAILVVGLLAAVALTLFAPSTPVSTPPPSETRWARLTPRTLQRQAAESAVAAAATAGQNALSRELSTIRADCRKVPDDDDRFDEEGHPKSKSERVIRISRIRSAIPHATPERALNDALEIAQKELALRLQALNPPVEIQPSLDMIRKEYIRPGSVRDIYPTAEIKELWRHDGLGESRQWAEFDLELSESQIRALRSRERTIAGTILAAGLITLAFVTYGFLRLDAITKGYLTTTLAISATGIAVTALVILLLVR